MVRGFPVQPHQNQTTKMKTKHTPGPWFTLECQANLDCKEWAICCSRPAKNGCRKNPRIAICEEMGGSYIGEDEGRANAQLIAAAPDLLAAAIAALSIIQIERPDGSICADLIAAITKATK